MMKKRIAVLIGLAVVLTVGSTEARATTMMRLSLEQISQASTAIVRGQVASQESRWNAAHTRIESFTTLVVSQVVKGQPAATVVVQQLGGTVGRFREFVPGSVPFQPLAEYVLFLEPVSRKSSNYHVVGMMQGAYRIYHGAGREQSRVINPQAVLEEFYASRSGGEASRPTSQQAGALPATMPFDEFHRRLEAALRTPLVIPAGTALEVRLEDRTLDGPGQVKVRGRTAQDVLPSSTAIVPAGSEVEGMGREVAGLWEIHWTAISVRGRRVRISGESEGRFGTSLSGSDAVVRVR